MMDPEPRRPHLPESKHTFQPNSNARSRILRSARGSRPSPVFGLPGKRHSLSRRSRRPPRRRDPPGAHRHHYRKETFLGGVRSLSSSFCRKEGKTSPSSAGHQLIPPSPVPRRLEVYSWVYCSVLFFIYPTHSIEHRTHEATQANREQDDSQSTKLTLSVL